MDRDGPGWTSLIAFVVLLFTASKVVVELRAVLSVIFGVRHREGRRGWAVFVLALLVTFVLRWLPPSPPGFRAAAGGAIVASLLLAGLRNLMSLYFQNAGVRRSTAPQ